LGLYVDEKNSRSSASSLNSSRVQKERGKKPYLIALDTIDCSVFLSSALRYVVAV